MLLRRDVRAQSESPRQEVASGAGLGLLAQAREDALDFGVRGELLEEAAIGVAADALGVHSGSWSTTVAQ